jgi:hypothetical protein
MRRVELVIFFVKLLGMCCYEVKNNQEKEIITWKREGTLNFL